MRVFQTKKSVPNEVSVNSDGALATSVAVLKASITAAEEHDSEAVEHEAHTCPTEVKAKGSGLQMFHERYSEPISKPTTNGSQSVHERYSEPVTNGSQCEEMVHERYSEPTSKPNTNGSQMVHEYHDFSSLPMAQKNLLKALYSNAQVNGNMTTQRLSLCSIAELARIPINSIKNTIWKLKNKRLLTTKKYRSGRSGWVVYEIPKEVFLDILNFDNGSQTVHERYSEPISEPNTKASYSSSIINKNITTTSDATHTIALPAEWQAIDIAPLAGIGFSEKHILVLYETNKVTPDVTQESINNYAWGLKNNPEPYKRYKNHLFTLMGVLKKGHAWIESEYESPEDILVKQMKERHCQQKERREKQLNELVNLEFPDWERALTQDQRSAIVPGDMNLDSEVRNMLLKSHFKKEVLLPKLRKDELKLS